MSKYIWDVPDTVAPIASITARLVADVDVRFSDSGSGDFVEYTLSSDRSTVLDVRVPVPFDGSSLADDEFVVARFWPRRQPVRGELGFHYHRNRNLWPMNQPAFPRTRIVADGELAQKENKAGDLVAAISTPSPDLHVDSTAGGVDPFPWPKSQLLTLSATLNRVNGASLTNGFAWDLELGLQEFVLEFGTPVFGQAPLPGTFDWLKYWIGTGDAGTDGVDRADWLRQHTTSRKSVNTSTLLLVGGGQDWGNAYTWDFATEAPSSADLYSITGIYDTVETWAATYAATVTVA